MLSDFVTNVRRNHALEHATVTLLLSKLGPDMRLVGRAVNDGFYIYGNVPTEALQECAADGLSRLQRGEAFWAVTPLCGTNIATAGIVASVASLAVSGGGKRSDKLPTAMMAGIMGVLFSQPLGRYIQKHLTTSPDLGGTQIVGIERRGPAQHKIVTTRAA
jgi:hypothetical protein